MLLSSIYPPGVYAQGVEGTALTRGRAWSPSSLLTVGRGQREAEGKHRNGRMGMGDHHGTPDRVLGGDAGDVMYPHYLINGRIPRAHRTFEARPGNKARLRFINSGGDTIFKVALGGHRMTVTHTDGFPVQPLETESIYLSMGERVDVEVILGDGVFPLTALAVGKNDRAFAVIRTAAGRHPVLRGLDRRLHCRRRYRLPVVPAEPAA